MFPELEPIDQSWLTRFRRNVRSWYAKHGRELPWRKSADPYRIWISEIMLQQTTVAAVVPYFERFLGRFPDVAALAAAEESEVLRYWEGLGYYSRARNIHKTARLIANDNQGQFPDDEELLQKLPGIGRYTAGAIASFAFGRKAGIVEANTLRLYSRLLGFRGDPRSTQGQRLLWEFANQVVPHKEPGRFNQSLMDLGATICQPTEPVCSKCPVRNGCQAFANNEQAEIPIAAKKPMITELVDVAFAIERDGKYLLLRRPDGERWAGLWDFPRMTVAESKRKVPKFSLTATKKRELESRLLEATGIDATIDDLLTTIRHTVTRYRIQLNCLRCEFRLQNRDPKEEFVWLTPEQFEDYPLSTTGRQFAELLVELTVK